LRNCNRAGRTRCMIATKGAGYSGVTILRALIFR
jgi:hypothetical protein